jgi:GMP synthase-like glutamine amidotransferase
MLIGILQTGAAPEALRTGLGDYPDLFVRLLAGQGFDFRTWDVEHMDFPASVAAADGWLITGSRHGAYEDHPFIAPLEAFIRAALGAGVPVVGICFGHQIMAQAMGGRVERFAGGWSVGLTDYDFVGKTLRLNAWHRDQVVAAPPDADVIATNPSCAIAGLAYRRGPGLSVQAHPEFDARFIEGLMQTRGPGLVPNERLAAARGRLGQPADQPALAARIAEFFRAHSGDTAPVRASEAAHG